MENTVNDPFENVPPVPDEYVPQEPDGSPEDEPLTRLTKRKPIESHLWRREFYPITALEAAQSKDELVCVKHSLLKWEGLRDSNLEKYNLEINRYYSIQPKGGGIDILSISGRTCALCKLHSGEGDDEDGCCECIIYEKDGASCSGLDDEGRVVLTPWRQWTKDFHPGPMINLLNECMSTLLGREHACPICSRNCYCIRENNVCTHTACIHWDDENQINV